MGKCYGFSEPHVSQNQLDLKTKDSTCRSTWPQYAFYSHGQWSLSVEKQSFPPSSDSDPGIPQYCSSRAEKLVNSRELQETIIGGHDDDEGSWRLAFHMFNFSCPTWSSTLHLDGWKWPPVNIIKWAWNARPRYSKPANIHVPSPDVHVSCHGSGCQHRLVNEASVAEQWMSSKWRQSPSFSVLQPLDFLIIVVQNWSRYSA